MLESLSSLCGLGWREGEAGEADEKAERHRDDVERRRCHDKDESGKDFVLWPFEDSMICPRKVRRPSGNSLFGTNEVTNDFVMVDLKTPFAAATAST